MYPWDHELEGYSSQVITGSRRETPYPREREWVEKGKLGKRIWEQALTS